MDWYSKLRHLWWRYDKINPDSDLVKNYYMLKYNIVKELKPSSILEIGVRFGYSAYAFLSACPGAQYIGIDNDLGEHGGISKLYPFLAKNVLSCFDDVTLIKADTQKEIIKIDADFIHVDGDHSEQGCYNDLINFENRCNYMLVDDFSHSVGVAKSVISFLNSRDYKITIYDDGYRGSILIYTNNLSGLNDD
jgi:predicted O-methyltransferase YrrM